MEKNNTPIGYVFLPYVAYLFFVLLAYVLNGLIGDEYNLALLHFGGVILFLSYWRLTDWHGSDYDSFGPVLLMVQGFTKIVSVIDALIYGARLSQIPPTVLINQDGILDFVKAEYVTNTGIVVLVVVWRIFIGGNLSNVSFVRNYHKVPVKISRVMYILALVVELLKKFAGVDLGVLAQVSSVSYVFGVAAIFFIAKNSVNKLGSSLLMALPMVFLALGSGMKENIFFPLIPTVIIFLMLYRQGYMRLMFYLVGILFFAMTQLYVNYVRSVTWGESSAGYSATELLGGFYRQFGDLDVVESFDLISSRVNLTVTHAITVYLADQNGYEPYEIFGSIPISLVPRFVWPSKPTFMPGARHTARIEGLVNVPLSDITTATATGFFAELYFGGWYVGLILGAALFGFIMASLQKIATNRLSNFSGLSFSFVTIYIALRFDEKHVIYAYTSILFIFAFVWVLDYIVHVFISEGGYVEKKIVSN